MNEILKKRIEEAVENYSVEIMPAYSDGFFERYQIADGFEAGAKYALSHQWISVDEALPEENEEVLCMMKSNYAIVSGYIYKENSIVKVATSSNFHFEDYEGYEVIAWMPIPEFETKNKEEKP